MILICYDGSADAKAAITQAGRLLGGQTATVLTVWQPFVEVLSHTSAGFGLSPGMVDTEEVDTASRRRAAELADEGAALARRDGFQAEGRSRPQTMTTADAILAEAEAVRAAAIVIGTRGLTGVKSMLMGSVSHAVLQHADRTVIVVPSAEIAATRGRKRHELTDAPGA